MSNNHLYTLLGAAGPGLSALAVTALILVGTLTVLVGLATLVAIFAGPERAERARQVLCHLLAALTRGGDQ
ncbi:hypothetical protein ACFWPX_36380 [Nocardia sp. NPDC058518]|uniref:hypothetical protein n=1 Tax=Nocardia sp. NPDC058518 TaxID=3346534 RepID=UPI00366964A9